MSKDKEQQLKEADNFDEKKLDYSQFKTPQERDDLDLLELTLQLHSRALMHQSKIQHDYYVEARNELEKRFIATRICHTNEMRKELDNKITEIIYKNSNDDSECLKIKFEKITNVINKIIDVVIPYLQKQESKESDNVELKKMFEHWYCTYENSWSKSPTFDMITNWFIHNYTPKQELLKVESAAVDFHLWMEVNCSRKSDKLDVFCFKDKRSNPNNTSTYYFTIQELYQQFINR